MSMKERILYNKSMAKLGRLQNGKHKNLSFTDIKPPKSLKPIGYYAFHRGG